jgi:hypothetical protein
VATWILFSGSSYRFIDFDKSKGSRLPWLDFSFLDIVTRVGVPIVSGEGLVDYDPQGMLAAARSYLKTRGHPVGSGYI